MKQLIKNHYYFYEEYHIFILNFLSNEIIIYYFFIMKNEGDWKDQIFFYLPKKKINK